jgi:pSer/pThr/pTyr-binding forkhead associated (FHA) protein
MENALLFHAGYHNPKGISFGISVLNNLGKVFTQFLAWQRLMQMIENLSEPAKKDESFVRHNKRGLLESQLPSQQGGMQKKYKYRQPESELNVQITGPVSKFNFVDSDKSSALSKLRQPPINNVPVGPSPFSGYPANPLFPNEKARAKGGWPAGGSNPNFPNMYNQGASPNSSRQPWNNSSSNYTPPMDKKKMADKPFAWKSVQDAGDDQRALLSVPRVILAAGLRGKNRSDQEINIKFTLPLVSPFLIGRKNSKCDLDLYTHTEVKTISHQHCGIAFIEETNLFEIQNFGRNGTRVNGSTVLKKIDDSENLSPTTPRGQAVLRNGDVIEIGKIALTFFVEHGGPLPSAGNKLASPLSNKPPPTQNPSQPPTQSPTSMSPGIRVGPDGQLMTGGGTSNGGPLPDLKKIFPSLKNAINSNSMNVINNTTNPNTNLSNSNNANTMNPLKRMMPQSVLGPNGHSPYSLQQSQSQLHQSLLHQQQQQQHFAQANMNASQHFNSMAKFPYPQTQSSLASAYNPYHKAPTQPYGLKYTATLPGGQMPTMQNRFPQTYSERSYIPQSPLPPHLHNLPSLPQSLPGTSPLGLASSSTQLPFSNSSVTPSVPQSIIQSLPQSVSSSLSQSQYAQPPPVTTGSTSGQDSPQSAPTASTFSSSPK